MTRKRIRWIALFLFTVILLCTIIYILPKVLDRMTKTVIAEYGVIEKTDNIDCYFVRNEKVYAPTESGKIKYLVDEGTKVRKGTKIVSITKAETGEKDYAREIEALGDSLKTTENCRAKINGVVSYKIDGYEAVMSTSRLRDINREDVKNMENSHIDLIRDKVTAGEPIYKIYKNEKWFMLFWTDDKTAKHYTKGMSVSVRLKKGDVKAVVTGVRKQDGMFRITMKCDRYYEGLSDTRTEEATVVTSVSSGLVIENSCLCEENGIKGVMVKNTVGEYEFTPVNVILSDGDKSVISADRYYDKGGKEIPTVNIYDELLRNP